jgi:hypothetical protein
MTRTRLVTAALAAVIVETGVLWGLTHIVVLPLQVAAAAAFAVGYVVLCVALRILSPASSRHSLGGQLRANALFGIGVLLLVEVMLYICMWLGLNLTKTNAALLLATTCWVWFGWPFLRDQASKPLVAGNAFAMDKEDGSQ